MNKVERRRRQSGSPTGRATPAQGWVFQSQDKTRTLRNMIEKKTEFFLKSHDRPGVGKEISCWKQLWQT